MNKDYDRLLSMATNIMSSRWKFKEENLTDVNWFALFICIMSKEEIRTDHVLSQLGLL